MKSLISLKITFWKNKKTGIVHRSIIKGETACGREIKDKYKQVERAGIRIKRCLRCGHLSGCPR